MFHFVCTCMLFDVVKYSSVWRVFVSQFSDHRLMHVNKDRLYKGSNAKIGQSVSLQDEPTCWRLNTDSIVLKGIIVIMSKWLE